MPGKITVTKTRDWLTPFTVEVAIDGRPSSTSKFSAPAKVHGYVWELADEHDLDVLFDVEAEGQPRRITPEEFEARITRICSKCRKAVPLAGYRKLWHVNQSHARGQRVHNGWAERCLSCEEAHGER